MAGSSLDPFTEFLLSHPRQGEEVFRLNEEGQGFLQRGKLKEAERRLREALSICEYAIPVLNNLALISFVKKDFRRAIRRAKRALKYHPENVFAYCTLAASFAKLGQRARAMSHLDEALKLFEDSAAPLDYLNKIVETLGVLEMDREVYEIYELYGREEDSDTYLDPLSFFQFGVAAANLGRWKEAVELWNRSLSANPTLKLNELYITVARLLDSGKAPPFRFSYDYGPLEEASALDPRHPPPEIKPLLVEAIWKGEEELRYGAIGLLGQYEDPWAEEFLFLLLRQPELPDGLKTHAGIALIERGALAEGEEVEVHLKGELRRVALTRMQLPAEPPPEAAELFEEGLRLKGEGDLEGAERAYREALELYPILAPAKVNLANILRFSERLDEAEQLLKEAIELEGSPVARLNLAALYLQREEDERAAETLAALSPEDLEEEAGRPLYYQLRSYIHRARGEFDKAERALQKALQLDPGNETLKGNLAHLQILRRMEKGFFRRLEEQRERRRKRYLSVPLSSKIPLEKALSNLTRENLMGMARELGVTYGKLRKGELVERLAGYLKENAVEVYKSLKLQEREAFNWIAGKGGSASYRGLIRKYGSTKGDSIDWYYEAPSSVVGRLCFKGLLFAGRDEQGKTIAVIPREILERLVTAG